MAPRDAHARVVPLRAGTLEPLHPAAAASVFWELDPLTTQVTHPEIDKEAWLVAMSYWQDTVGFSIVDVSTEEALATILYCPAADAPGALRMPTAPVSKDAWLVTSLHVDDSVRRRGWESVLLDSVIGAATSAGIPALEVFGVRLGPEHSAPSPACADLVAKAEVIGLTELAILESAGFQVEADHPVLPRLRLTLPPEFDLLTAREIAELLAELPAR